MSGNGQRMPHRIQRMLSQLAAALLAVASCSQCAFRGIPVISSSGDREVVYPPPEWPAPLRADLFRPAGLPAPVVVLLHSGDLRSGDLRWQMRPLARKLRARGYAVLNATYRSAPRWRYPAPLDDVRALLDWIEKHGPGEGLDANRVALFGYSAGGHLALLNGMGDRRVKAIVAGAAPSDLLLFEGGRLVQSFLGGTRAEEPERYRLASPLHRVTRESPPVFLYHGTADEIVPPIHSWIMKCELDAAGVPNELFWLEGKGHVRGFLFGGEAEREALRFLDEKLLIKDR
jgi:acetyl esterase/lipase